MGIVEIWGWDSSTYFFFTFQNPKQTYTNVLEREIQIKIASSSPTIFSHHHFVLNWRRLVVVVVFTFFFVSTVKSKQNGFFLFIFIFIVTISVLQSSVVGRSRLRRRLFWRVKGISNNIICRVCVLCIWSGWWCSMGWFLFCFRLSLSLNWREWKVGSCLVGFFFVKRTKC